MDIENLQIFHKTQRNISKTELPILNMQYARYKERLHHFQQSH